MCFTYYVSHLFQTCSDLGFTYTDEEWRQLRRDLAACDNIRDDGVLMVRKEDFFAALHSLAKTRGAACADAKNNSDDDDSNKSIKKEKARDEILKVDLL